MCVLALSLGGCGSRHPNPAERPAQGSAAVAAPTTLPQLPDPCRDPKGFLRAIEERRDAEITPRAQRALRLLAESGQGHCASSLSQTDTFTAPTK